MIFDLACDEVGPLPEYDLCIVGSGPAGMTLAVELADAGMRLALLESGLRAPSPRGDALRRVLSEGITIKEQSRERVLGGASTTWDGLSSPLDPIDFATRPFLRLPGWPLNRAELLPWWAAAAERYRFASLALYGEDGTGATGFPGLKARGDVQLDWEQLEEKVFLEPSEPQDFGRDWSHVFMSDGADLYLDATVLALRAGAPPAERRIRHVVLADGRGRRLKLRARAFVLAAGGIDNARLLLSSTDLCPAGLGNEHDQVGRGFMNHPKNYGGVIRLARPIKEQPYHFGCLYKGFAGYAGLRLSEEQQRRLGVLNAYVRLVPLYPWSDDRGVEAFVLLVKRSRGLFRAWKERRRDDGLTLRDYSKNGDDSTLQNERKGLLDWIGVAGLVLLHLPVVARYVWSRLFEGRAPPVQRIRVRNFMEMEPVPENRVLLAEKRDANGQRLPLVRHDTSALDRRSLAALHRALAEEVARNGLGTLESELERPSEGGGRWPIDQDASHHLGSTRMGRDPATSVVDPDLRLHGVENVWCAGGSVFPTSGCANPTFTIVALSIRLAEHLRTGVFGRPARARGAGVPVAAGPSAIERVLDARSPASAPGAWSVLVIGAGERVETDVLPAMLALPDDYATPRVVARRPRRLRCGPASLEVGALGELTPADLTATDLVYVAVSKTAVPDVLSWLQALGRRAPGTLARLVLVVDTPVLTARQLWHARRLGGFGRVVVAEDCIELPWLEPARDALGEIREALFDRSAWRYHALATVKALFGNSRLVAGRRVATGPRSARVELELAGGARATILEPREYARGRLRLVGARGVISDASKVSPGEVQLRLVAEGIELRDAGRVVGRAPLAPVERALLGPVRAGDTISARTKDLKRVGLARLLHGVRTGGGGHPLLEGLDDMLVDWTLEKRGSWSAGGPFDLHSRWSRLLLPRA